MSECAACGALVELAETPSGRNVALDLDEAPGGNIRVVNECIKYSGKGRGNRVAHKTTCPKAGDIVREKNQRRAFL